MSSNSTSGALSTRSSENEVHLSSSEGEVGWSGCRPAHCLCFSYTLKWEHAGPEARSHPLCVSLCLINKLTNLYRVIFSLGVCTTEIKKICLPFSPKSYENQIREVCSLPL